MFTWAGPRNPLQSGRLGWRWFLCMLCNSKSLGWCPAASGSSRMFQIIVCKIFQVFRSLFSEHYPLLKALDLLPQSKLIHPWLSRWWFQIFFIFTPIWGRFPIWLIFFKGVETTNRLLLGPHHNDNVHKIRVVSKIINFPQTLVAGCGCLKASVWATFPASRPGSQATEAHPVGYKEWTIMPNLKSLLNWPWTPELIYIYIYVNDSYYVYLYCVYSRYM